MTWKNLCRGGCHLLTIYIIKRKIKNTKKQKTLKCKIKRKNTVTNTIELMCNLKWGNDVKLC